MSEIAVLLAELKARGVDLWVEDGKLRYSAPRGAMEAAMLERLRANRDGILAALSTAIRPVSRDGAVPLSSAQQRLWFIERMGIAGHGYNTPVNLRLRGRLDRAALAAALAEIVRRHEALRTGFAEVDGVPRQVIRADAALTVAETDLSALPPDRRETEMLRLAEAENERPFDLSAPPLLRARLVRLGPDDHALLAVFHHIVFDGWSMTVFVAELSALYDAFAARASSPLPPLPVQYADFAAWQRARLARGACDDDLAYWRGQLADLMPVELFTDRPRPAVQRFQGAALPLGIPATLARAVTTLAQAHGATPFMLLLAVFLEVLHRARGEERPAVGTPVANRTAGETEGLIGFFVNTLVLRGDLSGDPSLATLLERVRGMVMDAFRHQDLPFESLVEALNPGRDLARNPLFQVMFAVQQGEAMAPRFSLSGVEAVPLPFVKVASRFDLELHLWPVADGGYAGLAVFDTDLFDAATVERLGAQYRALLADAVARPDAPLSSLSMMTGEDRACLAAWSVEAGDFPRGLVHQRFEAQAARTPDAPAVIAAGGTVSFGELDRHANRLAHLLRTRGVGPEVAVALCMDRTPRMLAAFLAILKAGGVYVPLDPRDRSDRAAAVLGHSPAVLLLTESHLAPRFAGVTLPLLCLDAMAGELADAPATPPAPLAPDTAARLCAIIHTSGSTGRPKGVALPHAVFLNTIDWHVAALGDGGRRTLHFSQYSFDIFFQELFTTWASGAAVVQVDDDERQDPERLADRIEADGVERLFMPFTPLQLLLAVLQRRGTGRRIREVFTAGEAPRLTPAVVDFFRARPGCRLHNHYGPTEGYVVTALALDGDPALWPPLPPIGRPLPGMRAHVVDSAFRPCPVGVPGELLIGGVQVARGYAGRPDLTAERFVPDPFGSGERLYRSGDRVRWRGDGTLEYLGRIDRQVKVRGYRVEPGEIEAALLDGPEVRRAVVALGADGRLVAGVVPTGAVPGAEVEGRLRTRLRGRLPEYMVPSVIAVLERLPTTRAGKLDLSALSSLSLSAPAAEVEAPPRSPLESDVAALFAEVLGLPAVGIHDDFFERGGHSLLITQLASRLRDTLGVEVPLRRLFETPTVAGIARFLENAGTPDGVRPPPLVACAPSGPVPLSFAQRRLWLLDRLGLARHAYVMPIALRLDGALDRAALERALDGLLVRHEPLRTIFPDTDGEPVQVIVPHTPFALAVEDLRGAGEAGVRARIDTLAREPFDLARGPIFRARLLELDDNVHVLAGGVHHIASDGWSLQVLVRELSALYRGTTLAPLAVRYADFAVWQRQWMSGPVQEHQLAYWRERLAGLPPLALPADRPRPAVESFNGAAHRVQFPAALSGQVAALGRRFGATPYMVLLAAFLALLHRVCGETRVSVGTPVANRNRGETESLIGFFVNTVVIDAECDAGTAFSALLAQVRERALGAFAHQDLPFERVVEELAPGRDLGRNPLFQTIFALQPGDTMVPRFTLPGLEVTAVAGDGMTVRFDLEVHLWPEPQGFHGFVAYNTDLFDAATVARLMDGYHRLLTAAVAEPERPVAALPLVGDDDRRRMAAWNATAAPLPDRGLAALFERSVRAGVDAVALAGDGAPVTYGELNARANRLARVLRRRGVGGESVVALALDRSVAAVVAILAVLKAGGAYLPLDRRQPARRQAALVADAGAALTIGRGAGDIDMDREGDWAGEDAGDLGLPIAADALAYVMHTSGSTGVPKGICVTQRNVARLALTGGFARFGAGETVMLFAPLSFDASTMELWAPLLTGGRVAIAPPGLPTLAELAGFIATAGVTTVWLTAGLFHEMAAAHADALGRCRQVLAGGDVLSPDAVRAVLAAGDGVVLVNGYGPTENTTFTCCHAMTDAAAVTGAIPIGRPIGNTTVHILDPGFRPVPVGVAGELCAGGLGVARGYLNRPDLTAERFIPDPFSDTPGARLYRTGDRARWRADGTVEFLGRIDQQVKIRGFRIEPGEIEAVLRSSAEVEQAAVTVHGEGADKRLVAYLVPRRSGDRDAQVQGWADLFDQHIYGDREGADALFDTTGWNSTYDGTALPVEHMRLWAADTVGQVLARRPRRVLEIGCGSGMLLFQIAPHTDAYYGTDISSVALERLGRRMAALGDGWNHVHLDRREAVDLSGVEPGSLDVVLLSSVVQYFPSLDYLLDVIRAALAALKPGGVIHLADLRNLRLHPCFATAVELAQAADGTGVAELRAGVLRRMAGESELLLDPALFAALPDLLPDAGGVEIRLQPGREHNELTRYRYTAVVRKKPAGDLPRRAKLVDGAGFGVGDLADGLAASPDAVIVTGLANARLGADRALTAALAEADPAADAQAVRRGAAPPPAVDPEDVRALAEARGYAVDFAWSAVAPDCFDAVFYRPGTPAPALPITGRRAVADLQAFANRPAASGGDVVALVRGYLGQRLPDYMMPAAFVVMDALPMTPSGKVDRAALPEPARGGTAGRVAPATHVETVLAALWAGALGLEAVGVEEDFFALGGHSLLAAKLASRLRGALGVELPLRLFFEHPTIAALAPVVESLRASGTVAAEAAIVPDPIHRHDPFPLTDIQQAYWIGRSDAFAIGNTAAHVYFEITSSDLDLPRLESAFNRLIRRHDMLRAVVLADGLQRILAEVPDYRFPRLDLRGRPADAVAAALLERQHRMSHQMLPADRWPLFEIGASLLDGGVIRLHVSVDTLIIDAHSLNMLFAEWEQLYRDPEAAPEPLALSFRDYVLAQVAAEGGEAFARSSAYWMKRLDDLPPAPELPLARSPDGVGSPRFVLSAHRLPADRWRVLKARGQALGLTPSGLVLAVFAEVLAAWSKGPSFTLNLTLFDRRRVHDEVDRIVGDFTSLVLLAVERPEIVAFRDAAQRLQRRLWQDLDHPHPGGLRLMRELARRQGRAPGVSMPVVFTSVLGLESAGDGEKGLSQFGEVGFRSAQTPQIWIDHGVTELDGDLILSWNVVEGLFPDGMIDAMFAAYTALFDRLAADEGAWERPVTGLLPAAQRRVRDGVNATTVARPPALLHGPLLARAAAHPERPAVIAGDRVMSFGELVARASAVAAELVGRGTAPDTLVAVVLRKGWEQAVATLGVLMAGAAYLPIDPGVPPERLHLLLAEGGAAVALTDARFDAALDWPAGVARLAVDRMDPAPAPFVPPAVAPESLAYVIFTSGSTGKPKGVAIDHRGAVNTITDLNGRFGVGPGDRVLALSALNFDLSVYDLFGIPGAGGAVVIPVGDEERDPAAWARLCAAHGVTVWNSVPALLHLHLDLTGEGDPGPVRLVMLSGDWIPLALPGRVAARWPGARFISLGGATEASIWSIWHPVERVDPAWKSIPYGTALENQSIHVLDRTLEPRPDWVPGDLYIGGIGLARCYWNDPERTAAAFVTHPCTGERLYRTGDLGCIHPDGVAEFLGREDTQVKVNGYRIELGEIEAALTALPVVEDAVVTAMGDPRGSRALVGYVVPALAAAGEAPLVDGGGWRRLVDAAALAEVADLPADDGFRGLWAGETERYRRSVAGALAALGVFRTVGERYDVDALIQMTGIAHRYRKWLLRGLTVLVGQGLLVRRDAVFESVAPLAAGEVTADEAGDRLAAVLTERVHSAELYADAAIPGLYERIFAACHDVSAAVIGGLVDGLPADRPLRVLEVGAGYGTTTRHILPLLPKERTRYRFTDISRFFLTQGAEDFADYPFIDYAILDLEKAPQPQGVEPHSVDLLIASSVLHDTRFIGETLEHLAGVLAPGGVMLVIEETTFHEVFDLGMGLQQGFDRFADESLRPHHPLLSRDQWRGLLAAAGFADVAVLNRPGTVSDAIGLDVIVARGAERVRRFDAAAVQADLARTLPDYMIPRVYVPLAALPLTANGKIDRKSLPQPDLGEAAHETGVAPRTELETQIAGVWEAVLGIQGLGVTDNLFERGADSLVATRAATQLRQLCAVEVPLRLVFERPTVEAQAEAIATLRWAADNDDAPAADAGMETVEL